MPDSHAADYLADLTTEPIFDHVVFSSEALNLLNGQTEENLEFELVAAARDVGIEDPYRFLDIPANNASNVANDTASTTVSSLHRSSMSIHSRDTQSTGVTSPLSRTSKDISALDSLATLRISPRISVSSDDGYDNMMRRFRYNARHRTSSNVSDVPSVSSLSSSQSKSTPRKQKRNSLFAMFRKDSRYARGLKQKPLTNHLESARLPSPQARSSPVGTFRLECGHIPSQSAVRAHIQDSMCNKGQTAPSCCGRPLPRSVLEMVLTKQEVDAIANLGIKSPDTTSMNGSTYGDDSLTSIEIPLSSPSPPQNSADAKETPQQSPIEDGLLNQLLEDDSFKSLKVQQKEQFQRISLFESNQRKALSAYHLWTLDRLLTRLESDHEEMTKKVSSFSIRHASHQLTYSKQHAIDLERLDESQIVAEHDLRKTHAQETQNVATALKYMEAYCSGSNPTTHAAHTVTQEDRNKLARQHLTQQKLPAKHESAINVLRARQEKDIKLRLQKQEEELKLLQADYERKKGNEEVQFTKDVNRLEVLTEARRKRIEHQWDLRFETWKRTWEKEHGAPLLGRIPHEAWPDAPADATPDPSSSLALYLLVTA